MNGLNDIVGQDAKEAGRWFSRDNLLINAYWGNKASIVNQRGKDEYVDKGYTIDGWAQSASPAKNGIVRVTDDGLQFVATGNDIGFYWFQRLDESLQAELGGETVTASVLTTTDDLYSFTVKLPSDISGYDSYVNGHYASFGGFVFDIFLGAFRFWSKTIDATSTVRAAKLEKGIGQTLAHKENGVWVQNRTTRYGDELRRCKWYQVVFKERLQAFARFIYRSTNSCRIMIPVDELRIVPTVTFSGNFRAITPTKAINFSGPLTTTSIHGRKGFVVLDLSPIEGLEVGDAGYLDIFDNDSYVLLNSNL